MVNTRQHGITTETVNHFLVDEGVVYLNWGEAAQQVLGATRDGNTFTVEQDVREIPIAGSRGPLKGARRVVSSRAMLTVNLMEFTPENLEIALAGTESEDWSESGSGDPTHKRMGRNRRIALSDYITNVTLVGEISGSTQPAAFMVKNALADGNLTVNMTDQNEAVIELNFTGHFTPGEDFDEPWEIYIPIQQAAS